jgi:hypothetical protein
MTKTLHQRLAQCARQWMRRGGSDLRWRHLIVPSEFVGAPADAARLALLAAGCELVDLLSESAEGRKALADLGLQPLLQQVEAE